MRRPTDRNVAIFAWTSLLNDVASEATLRVLPLFLSQVLGAGAPTIGLIEGVADSTATLTKLLSGWLSDRMPRRKPFVVAGYALSGLSKPFLLMAGSWMPVLLIRFADRLGKGVRTAPRDALVADSAAEGERGRAFGLISALDTVGAFVGLSIALVAIASGGPTLTRATFDLVVEIAIVPAVLAVAVVALGAREQSRSKSAKKPNAEAAAIVGSPLKSARASTRLPAAFWRSMAVFALFTLANSSDAFLILKAARTGIGPLTGAPFAIACLIALSAVQASIASPAGRLSDRIGRRRLLFVGWAVYVAAYAGFALFDQAPALMVLFALYGAYYGLTEGAQHSLVADLVPASERRGLAYGAFSFMTGVLAFPASLAFGLIASKYVDTTGFAADAGVAALACVGLLAVGKN